MSLAPAEKQMWEKSQSPLKSQADLSNAEERYESREKRILTEINRERLPSFAESLKKQKYMDLQPFYQRRSRWDAKKQSRLIESFLINIPVPPILLFEREYNYYEVMDGQQRITAISEFYKNNLTLAGLTIWPELNGLTYTELPSKIRAGIDRRSISSIVIVAESISDNLEALSLKQETFERLNTGGVDLSNQEVRNCLYYGKFNKLLLELSRHPLFTEAWDIPKNEDSLELKQNNFYKKMEDVELVLRFFAFRNIEHFRGGMKDFLDLYMIKSLNFSDEDINFLKSTFINTISLAYQIYKEYLFKPFGRESNQWKDKSYKAYYDAVMVGFSEHLQYSDKLINEKTKVIEATKNLCKNDKNDLFTGKGKNTKKDIQKRIRLFSNMLSQVVGE